MQKTHRLFALIFSLVFFTSVQAFSHTFSAGAKFFGLSLHPKGAVNAPLIPYKWDPRGIFVLHPGVTLNFDYYVWEDIVSVNAGIGPTFLYRRSWYKLPGYNDSFTFYKGGKNDDWQYHFILYGGEIETNVKLNDNFDLSFSVIPGGLDLINISFGARYNFKTNE